MKVVHSILAVLLMLVHFFAAQASLASPKEDPRAKEYKALINKITQGKYEQFKHLAPEVVMQIWAELLAVSGKRDSAITLMIKIIDAQVAKYGESDLRVAASF